MYHLMRFGEAYVKQPEEAYAQGVRQRQEEALHRRARELGYELTRIEPEASPVA